MNATENENQPERSLIRTKLQRPPVAPDILVRDRLLLQLEDCRNRVLTLISAPAGYGKSTLASRWMSRCDGPNAWVTLDERDADLRNFLGYVLAAVRQVAPEARLLSEAMLKSGPLPPVSVMARQVVNDLHDIQHPFGLVLDDYHHIRAGTPPNDVVTELLDHPPRSLHLVIVTRRDPPLPLSRLLARGQAAEIRAADLRFTTDEATEFLTEKLRLPIDRETAAVLEEKTEGWVTGLRLAGLSLRGREDPVRWAQQLSGSTLHIAEYLVTEVLSRQSSEVEAALTATSIVDRFCAPLCEAIHPSQGEEDGHGEPFDARRFIEWMVTTNLFVVPLDDHGRWYRYHALFRDYLQMLLRERSSTEDIAELHARASTWLSSAGLIGEAIQHALASGDHQAAARLATRHRYELMNASLFTQLSGWLAAIPDETVVEAPLLASAGAFIGIEQGRDAEVYRCVQLAEKLLADLSPESEDFPVLKSESLVLRSFIDMAWGRTETGRALAEEALASLPADAQLIRSLAVFSLAFCDQMAGNPARAVRVIRDALSNAGWPANIRARMHFYAAAISYTDGDLPGAMASCGDCFRLVEDLPFTHTRTFATYLSGAAHYWRNEFAEAEADLLDVLQDLPAANPSYSANACFIRACIELAHGRVMEAEETLERVRTHLEETDAGTPLMLTRAFKVEMAIRRGDLAAARRLSRMVDFDVRPPIWFFHVPQLTPIKLLLAEGSEPALSRARERLVELDDGMRRIHRTSVRIDVLVLLALVCQAQGDEGAALEFLQSALELAGRGPWIRNFVDLGAPMAGLLERLVANEPENGFAMDVLSACRAEAGGDRAEADDGAPGLSTDEMESRGLLTRRESEILTLLDRGLNNQEIADRLFISIFTVKAHLQNIYGKLDARGRARALAAARSLRLISDA